MSPIVWIAALTICAPLSYLLWSFITVDRPGAASVKVNLSRSRAADQAPEIPKEQPFAAIAKRLMPRSYEAKLDKLLAAAGRPQSMPLARLIVLKPLAAFGGVVLGLLFLAGASYPQRFIIAAVIPAVLYFIPDLLVRDKGKKRQQRIAEQLPDTLDQLLISVEAGLGFESAMSRVAAKGTGPLAEELSRTLQDLQVGRPRREAYQALADRSTIRELRGFIRAIIQADIYGIGIARVLRVQAKEMRLKRRQRAEEKAMKIPVKILFPLMFFILPVLFIVVMGPAVLGIIAQFS